MSNAITTMLLAPLDSNAISKPIASSSHTLSSSMALAYAPDMTAPVDDSALMLRYADGDVAAFNILYQRHNDSLYRYLLRLSNNRDTAADLFQEVWSKIIKARHRYRPSAKFSTYLYRVAHNAFVDNLRRNKRYADGQNDDPDLRASPDEGPDKQVEKVRVKKVFLGALNGLPADQRDTFLLHEEAGLTLEQIATVTGVPRETAKSRLRYAVTKLRDVMQQELIIETKNETLPSQHKTRTP